MNSKSVVKQAYKMEYTITLKSQYIYNDSTGDPNMISTFGYIPGSIMVGVCAKEFIGSSKKRAKKRSKKTSKKNAHKDSMFQELFLNGDTRFISAYPIAHNDNDEQFDTFPTPLHLQFEKGDTSKLFDTFKPYETQTSNPGGFLYQNDLNHLIHVGHPQTRINFHHSRDRSTGSSKEGQIFNYESINPGLTFRGYVIGTNANLEKLYHIMKEKNIQRIGRSRSAQYGMIRLEVKKPVNYKTEFIDSSRLTISLKTPAIIDNEYGCPTVSLECLEKHLNSQLNGSNKLKITDANIRTREVGGFLGVWNKPLPTSLAFKEGSSFVIEFIDSRKEVIQDFLRRILIEGIGQRRAEGYGEIVILPDKVSSYEQPAHPSSLTSQSKPRATTDNPPESLKPILIDIVKKNLLQRARSKGVEDSNKFSLNNNHLLQRLRMIIKSCKSVDEIKKIPSQLKSEASKQLSKCKCDGQSLEDHMKNSNHAQYQEDLSDIPKGIHNLIKLLKYKVDNFELLQTYWDSFLVEMIAKNNQPTKNSVGGAK